jgi:hypothetical protein
VNEALGEQVDRIGRLAALHDLLEVWDASESPISADARKEAEAAFDELDSVGQSEDGTPEDAVVKDTA